MPCFFIERKAEELPAEETEWLEAGGSMSADDVKKGVKRSCYSGWAPFGSRCFRFFNYPRTWAQAERYCLRFGANLVSIHSSFENLFVKVLIRTGTGQHTRTWIGATDSRQVAYSVYKDQPGSRFNYSAWNRGEPNNLYGWGREACVEINYGEGKGWNDLRCWLKRPFVCSK
uniref:C-type lectin domain-containing protein n=1 Tax=Myripristis murdjan TaxID=586833 RepID=A0A667YN32_9TELE